MAERISREIPVFNDIYQDIMAQAAKKADELRPDLPPLPTPDDLVPFEGRMYALDSSMIAATKRHQEARGEQAHGHGFEHLEWVATNGAFVAALECAEREIPRGLSGEIIQRTWRLGLLHDLERWRGFDRVHTIEGSKAATQLLSDLGISDSILPDQVQVHDDKDIEPRNDPRFDIPMFSVFAVDHLNWGREWEKGRWEGLNKANVDPNQAVHNYAWMEDMQQSPNFRQTRWGQEVAVPYLEFGIAIAKHIESIFTT